MRALLQRATRRMHESMQTQVFAPTTMADHEVQMDESDDIYEPEEPKVEDEPAKETAPKVDELEEGEEEDESGEMDEDEDDYVRIASSRPHGTGADVAFHQDVDIITKRKDGTKAAPPPYVHLGEGRRRRFESS